MAKSEHTVKVNKIEGLTLRVELTKRLRIRVTVGIWLMRLAVWMMGCNINVIDGRNDERA